MFSVSTNHSPSTSKIIGSASSAVIGVLIASFFLLMSKTPQAASTKSTAGIQYCIAASDGSIPFSILLIAPSKLSVNAVSAISLSCVALTRDSNLARS